MWILALAFASALAVFPDVAANAALDAMETWAVRVAPGVFPFMIALPALTDARALAAYERAFGKIFERVFGIPGRAAPGVIIGFLAGSPAGASALARAFRDAPLSNGQALRAAALSSGVSPMFILAMFPEEGLAIVFSQLAALCLSCLALRFYTDDSPCAPGADAAGWNPVSAILGVCQAMVLFGVMGALVTQPLRGASKICVSALLEVTLGLRAAEGLPAPVRAAIVGFGGISIIYQNSRALGMIKAPALAAIKIAHAGLTLIISYFVLNYCGTGFQLKIGDQGAIMLPVALLATCAARRIGALRGAGRCG